MLIITGTGRCGTSLLARYYHALGYDFGDAQWHDGWNAGFERHDVSCLMLEMCRELHHLDTFRDKLSSIANYQGIKDPRLLLYPEVAQWFQRSFPEATWLLCERDLTSVANSYNSRYGGGRDTRKAELEMASHKFKKLVKFDQVIPYPACLTNYELVYNEKLVADYQTGETLWFSLVDPTMNRY